MKNLKTLAFSLYKKTNFSGVDKVKIKLTRKPTQKNLKSRNPTLSQNRLSQIRLQLTMLLFLLVQKNKLLNKNASSYIYTHSSFNIKSKQKN